MNEKEKEWIDEKQINKRMNAWIKIKRIDKGAWMKKEINEFMKKG